MMKTIGLIIKTDDLKMSDESKDRLPQEIVANVIKNIILSYGAASQKHGLTEEERHKYYKICDAFDKAIADTLMPLLSSVEQDRSAKREAEPARAARRARLRVLK
jgi:hypothetical protein